MQVIKCRKEIYNKIFGIVYLNDQFKWPYIKIIKKIVVILFET